MNIKEYRKKHRLSQAALAQQIGVDYHTVMRWEKGQNKPSPMALKVLEMIFKETK